MRKNIFTFLLLPLTIQSKVCTRDRKMCVKIYSAFSLSITKTIKVIKLFVQLAFTYESNAGAISKAY